MVISSNYSLNQEAKKDASKKTLLGERDVAQIKIEQMEKEASQLSYELENEETPNSEEVMALLKVLGKLPKDSIAKMSDDDILMYSAKAANSRQFTGSHITLEQKLNKLRFEIQITRKRIIQIDSLLFN